MATDVIHALRSVAGWTANQAAMEALYGVDNYYTTLGAWWSAHKRDLVVADENAILEIYDDFPGGVTHGWVEFNGWTCDSARQILIRAAVGEEYDPVADTGAYLQGTGTGYLFVPRANTSVVLSHLKLATVAGATKYFFHEGTKYDTNLRHCVVVEGRGTLAKYLENCLLINCSYYSFDQATAKNCTVISQAGYGSYGGQIIVRDSNCKNVLVYNETVGGYGSFYGCSGDYNAGEDASAPGANSIDNITTAEFEDYANGDYHLASGSVLIGAANNLIVAGDLISPQYDIDDDQWPDTGVWDIGFDFYVATGGGSQSIGVVSIASAEAVNSPGLVVGSVGVSPGSVASAEAVGSLVVQQGSINLEPGSIGSAASVGSASVAVGSVSISLSSIVSAESFGAAGVLGSAIVEAGSVGSGESVPAAGISSSAISIAAASIGSDAAVSSITLNTSAVSIAAGSVVSGESVSSVDVVGAGVSIGPGSIGSGEVVPAADVAGGSVSIGASSISSGAAVGLLDVIPQLVVSVPTGIASAEVVDGTITLEQVNIIRPDGLASESAFGFLTIVGGTELIGWLEAQIAIYAALDGEPDVFVALDGEPGINSVH